MKTSPHTIALLAPEAMGAGIAARLSVSGAGTILTNLEGRSGATIQRAGASNMQHESYAEIVERATCIYCVAASSTRELIFVDCNTVNPESVKRMTELFDKTSMTFLDGLIIGTPPSETFNPGIYVVAAPKDAAALDSFTRMSTEFGLNIIALRGEGAGIGDASALKMAHAVCAGLRLCRSLTGFVQLINRGNVTYSSTAANAASPSTAEGLLHLLNLSQPVSVDLIICLLPPMPAKAYRFVGEMEVSGFVGTGSPGAHMFEGLAGTSCASPLRPPADSPDDVQLLLKFVELVRETRAKFDVVWVINVSTVRARLLIKPNPKANRKIGPPYIRGDERLG
ncbi:hypothetical protein B0H17DRAFT_1200228 [Mycena rosella]|uniref:Phosphogluconate dehydrogenase NAD-binding putative C-terminal domain-containing protein n=1 Tax=Mycena rosella TaxID=1033263 RepID=A0AAD7DKC5_MYCRO|nr:hypothetical protein B0H17DRAFT_1200228 [Mycena rosella]